MSAYATMMPEVQEQSVSAPLLLSTPRSALTRDDMMNAREVSDFLKLPVSTVYELARRGEIPARRLGRTWRFLRSRLEELLAT